MFFYSLIQYILDICFPQTELETYIHELSTNKARLPTPSISLIGSGIAAFSYRNKIIRALVHRLKYYGDIRVAHIFGTALAPLITTYLAQTTLTGPFIVIPIPLSRRRLWWRGYNQADVIAQTLCTTNPQKYIYTPHILKRHKHTHAQAKIKDTVTRLFNARNIFMVSNSEKIKGAHIILVDDVITTGATLRSATQTLLSAGAHSVTWLAVAH